MDKAWVRLQAALLLIGSPVLIPLACMAKCQWNIVYFFIERYSELRTGNPYEGEYPDD